MMRPRGQPPHKERRSSPAAGLLFSLTNNNLSTSRSANKGNNNHHHHRRRRWASAALAVFVGTFVVAQIAVNKAYQQSIVHSLDVFMATPSAMMQHGITSSPRKVIHLTGLHPFAEFMIGYYGGKNRFCEAIDGARRQARGTTLLPILYNISFSCDENFRASGYGTGNVISALYGLRLAAQVYDNVELHFTCDDAETTKESLVLPWLTGYFSPRTVDSAQRLSEVSLDRACGEYETVPIAYLYREMMYDLRRMAVALVGVPDPHHPSADFAREFLWSQTKGGDDEPQATFQLPNPQPHDKPIFPNVELDDAVIHFRCGDLMNYDHPNFAFLRFNGYTKYISPEARSIGILTQPFQTGGQTRDADVTSEVRDRCRLVVEDFVEYIHESHPHSRVTIRNDPNETISLAYARMIMANESIAGVSTFGVFPVMATFGKGYLRNAVHPRRKYPNKWTTNPPLDRFVENLKIVEEPDHIMSGEMKNLWKRRGAKAVVAWFRGDQPASLIGRFLELFGWPKRLTAS
jgi:hypothetical protein